MNEAALLALVEAIYALDLDDRGWLEHVLYETFALIGPEYGYIGFFYAASELEAPNVWNVCAIDVQPEQRVSWLEVFRVDGFDASGTGCAVMIGMRELQLSVPEAQTARLARVAHHVATALRCRQRLGISKTLSVRASAPSVDKTPAPPTLEQIRATARTIDAERVKARAPGRPALAVWRPFGAAGWTVVDRFDESGEHYVLAREDSAQLDGPNLTQRERQVISKAREGCTNKEIARALGIADSTVRVLMARVAGKLGVRSRSQLLSHASLREVMSDRAADEPPD